MASKAHCLLCFETLSASLDDREPLSLDDVTASWNLYQASKAPKLTAAAALRRTAAAATDSSSGSGSSSSVSLTPSTAATSVTSSAPLFVTWNTIQKLSAALDSDGYDDPDNLHLRGCIGTFEPVDLDEGLSEYAAISAFQDSRFRPIRTAELPKMQNAVTLLTDFEPVDDPRDWEVGTHGVRLSFHDRGRRYGSTYLPDVAAEQGWTKDETLLSLMRKAGWSGSESAWKKVELKVTRYQGKKTCMRYAEYKAWRDWADSKA